MTSLAEITKNGTGIFIISPEDRDIRIDASKNSKYNTIFFNKDVDNIDDIINVCEDFEYSRDGKNLVITNGEQVITLENYFTTENGFTTKSPINTIAYKGINPPELQDYLTDLLASVDSANLGYVATANKKNVVTGTLLADVIDMSDSTKKKGFTIKTGDGDDTIIGSSKNDKIICGTGDKTIKTTGGNDTITFTDDWDSYGEIDSTGSKKVTIKLKSFNSNLLHFKENDLKYGIFEYDGFLYKDFKGTTAADLWIQNGKKKYNILNKTDEVVDYTKNKSNKFVYLSSDNTQTYNGSKKGTNVVYSNNQNVTFNYKGANDKYISYGESDDEYNAKITKTTKLVINDNGGDDTITFNNKAKDLVLFFDVEAGNDAEGDIIVYNKNAMTYTSLTKAVKSSVYSGGVNIKQFFDESGCIENVNLGNEEMNLENWAYYVNTEVSEYLENNGLISVSDVFRSGTKAQKKALTKLIKSLTYQKYLNLVDSCISIKDYNFQMAGADLVYTLGGNTERVENFFAGSYIEVDFYAINDEGNLEKCTIGSDGMINDNPITKQLANNDELTIDDNLTQTEYTIADNAKVTLNFTNKAYTDFYTKEDPNKEYAAGDPLIYEDDGDLYFDEDLTISDIYDKNCQIQIVDKNSDTKNIIIGSGTVTGTFESEIIIGSTSAEDDDADSYTGDIIYANGGNDLIYTGEGDDTVNLSAGNPGDPTGNNTAHMIGIGGTELLDSNPVSAISVYDAGGNDTYNTSFDVGLYIEDSAGNDTLNITDDAANLLYFFDVANPNATGTPTLYTDLFICDKAEITALATDNSFMASFATQGIEALQGNLGYAWIDDYYGGSQKIETVNYNGTELNLDYTDTTSPLNQIRANVQAWLTNSVPFIPSHDNYDSAWSVIESGNVNDIKVMLAMYAK